MSNTDIGKKHILLQANEYNWGLSGPGDWAKTEWHIFYDGAFEVISSFRSANDDQEMLITMQKGAKTLKPTMGIMNEATFAKLQEALKDDPWRDPAVYDLALDGTAWQFIYYREDGNIEKTSGKPNYIYGHRILETIASLLPRNT